MRCGRHSNCMEQAPGWAGWRWVGGKSSLQKKSSRFAVKKAGSPESFSGGGEEKGGERAPPLFVHH